MSTVSPAQAAEVTKIYSAYRDDLQNLEQQQEVVAAEFAQAVADAEEQQLRTNLTAL